MTKVVGVINDLHMVGKDVRGTVILLDTPEANKLKDSNLDITLFGHGDVDWSAAPYKVIDYHIDKAIAAEVK